MIEYRMDSKCTGVKLLAVKGLLFVYPSSRLAASQLTTNQKLISPHSRVKDEK